jgi:hypothetical protein
MCWKTHELRKLLLLGRSVPESIYFVGSDADQRTVDFDISSSGRTADL